MSEIDKFQNKYNDYRMKHHRCKFCKYWQIYKCFDYNITGDCFAKCVLKGTTHFWITEPRFRGMFCSYYDPVDWRDNNQSSKR